MEYNILIKTVINIYCRYMMWHFLVLYMYYFIFTHLTAYMLVITIVLFLR